MPTSARRSPSPADTPSTKASTSPATAGSNTMAAASSARKPVGRSLHIGLNAVSPKAYAGWSGDLMACEADAIDMTAVCKAQGLQPVTLLTAKATRARVLAALRAAAKALRSGDLFVLSYSGHGGQVPDRNRDEADRQDETWCLWDGQLLDDELYLELARFAAGVRILVLSDSCHSGTVTRAAIPASLGVGRPRMMPPAVALRAYAARQAFYDGLQQAVARASGPRLADPDAAIANAGGSVPGSAAAAAALSASIAPAVILISGCQDNQTSMDGEHNGAFTEQVLRVWKQGRFQGSHARFHALVRSGLPPTQSPNLFVLGAATAFLAQRPFSV